MLFGWRLFLHVLSPRSSRIALRTSRIPSILPLKLETVYEDEVEGHWVTLKVYESENDEDEDDDRFVHVTVAPIEHAEPNEAGQKPVTGADADDNSINLDPDLVEDLKEELIKIGLSPEAATWIVGTVPV